MPAFFPPFDTPSWGCRDCICMQTLWAENLICDFAIKYHQRTTQNSNKDALFLFFVMGTLPPLPAISPLLWCQWQLQTVCPENIKLHQGETQTKKISAGLGRKVTCSASFRALKFYWQAKHFLFLGHLDSSAQDLEVGPLLFVLLPSARLWLITKQFCAKMLQIHPNIWQTLSARAELNYLNETFIIVRQAGSQTGWYAAAPDISTWFNIVSCQLFFSRNS